MNTDKMFIMMFIVLIISAFGAMAFNDYQTNKSGIEYAKAGLEQCTSDNHSGTIWVKDCEKYLRTKKELK